MCVVLIASFILRLKSVWFGYPLQLHPDEPVLVNAAQRIYSSGDLNPNNFLYPSLNIYLQATLFHVVSGCSEIVGHPWLVQEIDYYICARILNVIFSTLTIYIVYEIGRRLLSVWTGLAAVCFISVSSLHVNNSYFATVDTSTAFWSSLTCLMAVMIYLEGCKRSLYVIGGVCAGLAIGCKYTAFPAFFPILVVHIYNVKYARCRLSENIFVSISSLTVAFIVSTPFAILDFNNFISYIVFQRNAYMGHPGAETATNTSFVQYFNFIIDGYGGLPLILALLGVVRLFIKNSSKALLLLSFPAALFILYGSFKVHFLRNVVPIIPFLSLLSGYAISSIAELKITPLSSSFKSFKYLTIMSAIFITLMCINKQVAVDLRVAKNNSIPDTRWVSMKWIRENIPSGVTINREAYTPPVEKLSQYIVKQLGLNAFKNNNYADYIILSSAVFLRYTEHAERYPTEAAAYKQFFDNHELLKEFIGDGVTTSGPTIRIYKTN